MSSIAAKRRKSKEAPPVDPPKPAPIEMVPGRYMPIEIWLALNRVHFTRFRAATNEGACIDVLEDGGIDFEPAKGCHAANRLYSGLPEGLKHHYFHVEGVYTGDVVGTVEDIDALIAAEKAVDDAKEAALELLDAAKGGAI